MTGGLVALVACLVVGLLLLGVVARGGTGVRHGRRGPRPRGSIRKVDVRAGWNSVRMLAETGPAGMKQALLDADKLFDHALRDMGTRGDTMGERLKHVKPKFDSYKDYDAVWRAHKLRNALAHEVGFDLVPSQVREALDNFERGLKRLGAL